MSEISSTLAVFEQIVNRAESPVDLIKPAIKKVHRAFPGKAVLIFGKKKFESRKP